MRTMLDSLAAAGRRARVFPVLVLMAAVGLSGCDSLIDVDNPNSVPQDDFENPVAAASVVSGAWAEVADAWGETLTPYATASDELKWIGSRDSWKQLEEGDLSDRTNEFSDAAFPNAAEARWLSDEAIRLMEAHVAAGVENFDMLNLVRAYLMGAIAYTIAADRWDDFVVASDREEGGPAVGEANMSTLYDVATGYLTSALPIAQAEGDTELEATILALRASVAHRKAVWGLVQPSVSGATPKYAGVSAAAVNDANAALALIGGTNWAFRFTYNLSFTSNDLTNGVEVLDNDIGAWTNERQEHRIDDRYGVPSSNDKTITGTALTDPVSNVPSPALTQIITEFGEDQFGPLRVVSEQELHLILAENALAAGNLQEAEDQINNLRGLFTSLGSYDRTAAGAPSVGAMVQHHRMASLFLQGRRLSDMYRFGVTDTRWASNSEAILAPGTFLPITQVECNANPNAGC